MAEENIVKLTETPLLLEWLSVDVATAGRPSFAVHYAIPDAPPTAVASPTQEFFRNRECFYVLNGPLLGEVRMDDYSLYTPQSSICEVPLYGHNFESVFLAWKGGVSAPVRALLFAEYLRQTGRKPRQTLLLSTYTTLLPSSSGEAVHRAHFGVVVRCDC